MNRIRLREQLKYDEGVMPSAYQDSEGYWTIGVGRLIDAEKGGRLRDDEIDYLLNNDLDEVINQVTREFPWYGDMNDPRQEVICNMVFNLGLNGFKGFKKMIAACERHDWETASVEMMDSKWSRQVGQRAVRLSDTMRKGEW